MNSKKVLKVVGLLAVVLIVTSCNRGGSGCPYELSTGLDLLTLFIK